MENPVRVIRTLGASAVASLIGAVAGALLWHTLPAVTGVSEPWDETGVYSIEFLFGFGLCAGFFLPFHSFAVWLGSIVGQLIYAILFTGAGPLLRWPPMAVIGFGLDAAWGFIACCGAFVGSWLRVLAKGKRGFMFAAEAIRHWPNSSPRV